MNKLQQLEYPAEEKAMIIDQVVSFESNTVNIKNYRHCVLRVKVETSCLINSITDSVVIIDSCQQLRVHDSSNCLFVVSVAAAHSRSGNERGDGGLISCIIEDCETLKFTKGFSINDFNNLSDKSRNYKIVDYDIGNEDIDVLSINRLLEL